MIDPENLRKYSEFIGLGSEIAAAMIVPLLIGVYLDKHYNTEPWGVAVGIIIGFLGVFNAIYRVVIKANRNKSDDKHKNE